MASIPSFETMFILSNTSANWFLKEILILRWLFSTTFSASATLMLGVLCVSTSITMS